MRCLDASIPAGRWLAYLSALILWLAACAIPQAPPSMARVSSPPEWRSGDRWVYEWKSGSERGTKSLEVVEIREVNRIRYYLVRIGSIHHYYTLDLHWAGSARASKVEARMVPPQPWFEWPLEVGRRWVHHGAYEERDAKRQHNDVFAVVAAETVEVPAGRFHALRVVREAGQDSDEYWYAPEVRWYVRWIGRRGETQFEEQLREYSLAPTRLPESAPAAPPSKTK